MALTEGIDIGKAVNDLMRATEGERDDPRDMLPKPHHRPDNRVLLALILIRYLPGDPQHCTPLRPWHRRVIRLRIMFNGARMGARQPWATTS